MPETNFGGVGDQQLIVSNSAIRLTPPTGKTARHAIIYVGDAAIRWLGGQAAGGSSVVGTTPTATVGILVPAGAYIDWTDPQGDYSGLIQRAQFIRVTTDATLDILYMN